MRTIAMNSNAVLTAACFAGTPALAKVLPINEMQAGLLAPPAPSVHVETNGGSATGDALVFHGPNKERRTGGASPLWQAGAAAEAEIGTCLPWEI